MLKHEGAQRLHRLRNFRIHAQLARGKRVENHIRDQRIDAVAVALAHDPELLIMDEPTAGMDPAAREEFLDTVLEFMQDEDHTALVSSHITSDLERIADYIVFIHKGRVVLSGEKDALLERFGIARCGKDAEIREKDLVVSTRRGEFGTSMLVDGREEFRKANPDIVVDDASLEDIMVYVIRGDSQ